MICLLITTLGARGKSTHYATRQHPRPPHRTGGVMEAVLLHVLTESETTKKTQKKTDKFNNCSITVVWKEKEIWDIS